MLIIGSKIPKSTLLSVSVDHEGVLRPPHAVLYCTVLYCTALYCTVLFQSIMKESYDHHAAIYFLLLDKLREQRTSPAASLAR